MAGKADTSRIKRLKFGDRLKQSILEKAKVRCLEVTDAAGFFSFTNSKKQIKTVDDIKGVKYRTMSLPSHIAFFKAMGASAIPIAWAEVFTSLQTGVVDGQHNPLGQIIHGKIYEVQKYLSLTNHIFSTHWLLMNEDFFKGLTPEEKKAFADLPTEAAPPDLLESASSGRSGRRGP